MHVHILILILQFCDAKRALCSFQIFGAKIQIFEKCFDCSILTFKANMIELIFIFGAKIQMRHEFALKSFRYSNVKFEIFWRNFKCKLVFCPHFSLQLFQYVTFLKLYFQCQTMSGKCNPVVVVVVLKCKYKKQRLPPQILFRYRDKNHKLSEW